jgi:septal ring factor EnvC (AmiA/AmiB activator)
MNGMNENQRPPDVWSRLWQTIGHLLKVLLRVLFVLVLAILLSAGVYFGAPWVYRQVIQPIQSSVAQLGLLQRQVDENNAQWAESFGAQQQRIADLESQLAGQGERVASLEADLGRMEEALATQQAAMDGLSAAVSGISSDYASLGDVEALDEEFVMLQEEVVLAEQIGAQIDTLERRIVLVQTWQEVLKTHIYLTEGNVGDAETTLALAMVHLSQASALGPGTEPESEREAIATTQEHLTRAASRLREQPIIAAQDLESAWYELGGLITAPE